MNEPMKKPGHAPESYDPKDVPEIVRMAAEQGNAVAEPKQDAVPQPEIVTRAFRFAGYEAAIDLSEAHWTGMDDVKATMQASLNAIADKMQPLRFVGMWQADPKANYKKKKNHSKRLFFFGVEVSSLDSAPANCVTRDLPESTYAVFKGCDHGAPKYEWLAAAGYEQDGEFQTKYVLDMEQFDDIDLIDSDGMVDWYVPVQPASYDPKDVPEIIGMAREQSLRPQETLVETFDVNGIAAEVVEWRETIWCGKLAYGRKNGSEPNVGKLLKSYLKLDNPALTKSPTEPDWSVCMSLYYLSERPRGILFGMQVDTEQQPEVYDIYKVPPARFMRVLICEETAQALGVEMWRGGIPPYEWIGEHIAPRCGYRYGDDTLPVFEYYGYYDPETNRHKFCWLYVPVEKSDANNHPGGC